MLALLAATLTMAPQDAPPAAKREFRAAWIATVDNIDWPTKRGLPVDAQKKELMTIIETASDINLNALILQVRPSVDALYESSIEPWSEYLTGAQGLAPNPKWDPLAFAIEECHKRGIELHAWFNPYRAWHPAAKGEPASNYIGNTNPGLAKNYGKYQWLDPGEPQVQQRSYDVFLDVVKRYDVDGIHIDDYFYPYPEKGSDGKNINFPDDESYAKYGKGLSRSNWRRKNVDDFIERVYKGIKAEKQWVKFGISPFGIYRPGIPEGIKAGIDQYEELYADAQKWLNEGWCDYYTPQLYWPIGQKPQAYPVLLNYWASQNTKKRHLWPGNFTSRLGENNPVWSAQEVLDQIAVTRTTQGSSGNVHFSMKALTLNYKGIADRLKAGPYASKAMIPATTWVNRANLAAPKATRSGDTLQIQAPGAWMVAVYEKGRSGWMLRRVAPPNHVIKATGPVAISSIDRYWNESPRAILK
ncbi:MAG TPA: family 10 glycosylhydrolase [Fimbriimonadaceae bacterium]|nr:family 10 glycosylhydrolase [Fimbriimonadaceae bacterium]